MVIISIADLVSSELFGFEYSPEIREKLEPFLKYSGITLDQLRYFQEDFMIEMKQDQLFQECRSLFRL